MDIISERTIALAGVIQACAQVQSLARTGGSDPSAYDGSIKSILVLDAVNTPAIYGGINGVKSGLSLIVNGVLNSASPENVEILRYTMTILQLQRQLYTDPQRFSEFATEIERLSSYAEEELIDACSSVYQSFISSMQPQVIVQGEESHLQNPDVPPKVRSLLLAALRSAVLWQQKGGGRFRLLWERTRMQNAARFLLASSS